MTKEQKDHSRQGWPARAKQLGNVSQACKIMGFATLAGLFLIPVCYVFVQGFAEWGRKKPATAATPSPELAPHSSSANL